MVTGSARFVWLDPAEAEDFEVQAVHESIEKAHRVFFIHVVVNGRRQQRGLATVEALEVAHAPLYPTIQKKTMFLHSLVRECNLSFVEDAGLQERFDRLEADGAPRVDIIEQIVLNNLPESDRIYRPKRRRRSWL